RCAFCAELPSKHAGHCRFAPTKLMISAAFALAHAMASENRSPARNEGGNYDTHIYVAPRRRGVGPGADAGHRPGVCPVGFRGGNARSSSGRALVQPL